MPDSSSILLAPDAIHITENVAAVFAGFVVMKYSNGRWFRRMRREERGSQTLGGSGRLITVEKVIGILQYVRRRVLRGGVLTQWHLDHSSPGCGIHQNGSMTTKYGVIQHNGSLTMISHSL